MRKLNYQSGRYGDLIGDTQKELDDLTHQLRNAHVKMRSMMNQGSPDPGAKLRVESRIQDLQRRVDHTKEHLSFLGENKGDVDQQVRNTNLGVSAAVGLPAVFGLSYADQAWKHQ